MEKGGNIRLRILSYAVIAYMMLAFGWWSVLLFTKNQDAFQAKKDRMALLMIANGEIRTEAEFAATEAYRQLYRDYKKQEWMIAGEVLVFTVILVIGVILINRGYNKEIRSARQRRNFLLSITHELKSPIASIRLVLETFQKRRLRADQQHKLVGNALNETERLNRLVNDLLLSARLESAYQPNREMVDLPELLQDLIEGLRTKYGKRNFHLQIDEDIPYLLGDQMGLSSVILNLLENAVKYSPRESPIEVSLHFQQDQITLAIKDQGIGVPDKEKKRIFDKFYRVGSEDTRRTKGTGLGLYIVRQIVEAHSGTILVKDNTPRGSIFEVRFPAKPEWITKETTHELNPIT